MSWKGSLFWRVWDGLASQKTQCETKWLGETEVEDQHVVEPPEGIIRGKAIRQTAEPWRSVWTFMVKEKPFEKGTRRNVKVNFGSPMTPRAQRTGCRFGL